MSAPTSGLARLTIRAPRRRLDLAIPHQVPLAELLPEVLRRAGEAGPESDAPVPTGGWVLRRGDGASLQAEAALAQQGVRDGDVLYLVPRHLPWPEPAYDDVIEEIAASAQRHGRTWEPAATRTFALVAAGLVLATGLAGLLAVGPPRIVPALVAGLVAVFLLGGGALLARALGDPVAGATAAAFGMPYAASAGLLATASTVDVRPDGILVGSAALVLAAALGAAGTVTGVGVGLRVFVGGATVGLAGLLFGALWYWLPPSGAAAILVVALVAGIGLAPLLAVRLGRLPLPVVSAAADVIAAERHPSRSDVVIAVARADELLDGMLLGISVATLGGLVVLSRSGLAGPMLAGLAATALLLRARLFPTVAARLPLLSAGLIGLAVTATGIGGSAARLIGVALACCAVVALLVTAATAHRRRPGGSPYLARLADILDITAVVALAPVACAVLDLYSWVRTLAS